MFLGSRFCQDIMTVTSSSSSCPGLLGVWPPYKATSESKLTLALVSSQFDFDINTRSCNNLASLIFKSAFSLTNTETAFVDFYEGCTANRSPLDTLRGQRVCQMYASLWYCQGCLNTTRKSSKQNTNENILRAPIREKTHGNLGGPGQYILHYQKMVW